MTDKDTCSTDILDSRSPELKDYAARILDGKDYDPVTKAVKLYYAVRDNIWYDPYLAFYLPKHYQASRVLKSGRGFCISKAALLCALGRTCGIASRLGFATVKNHIASRQLLEYLGSDLFVFHGYTEFYLNEKWVKATPAFNIELCIKHKVPALEFNGSDDSVFQPYNSENQQFMEYVEYHGEYADVPVNDILSAWKKTYGQKQVEKWINDLEKTAGNTGRDFMQEDVYKAE
ncbi:transglutaminase-like domain-containing protein [Desulfobacterales bacterium HSG17]|nr:transglutaminase-like domain-containing protein [Desulfobacterales bacterium HSG17]